MSHELRTPLNAIAGHAQLMELGIHGPVTEAQQEALGRVQRAQQHLLGLITDILDFAKIEAGRVEFALRPLDVREVLQATAPLVEPQCHAKGITCALELPDHPCTARADRDKLAQVLLNLFSNAVKFTPTGGRILARVEADGSAPVRVVVADTGIGIAPEQLDSIFEPFVQVGRLPHDRTEGTGLGLTISRDLARGMGGELTAASVPGEGSTFTLVLPAG